MSTKDDNVKKSRLALYVSIAILTFLAAFYLLAKVPPEGWPINLIHLLTRH
jgi:hypothetical protein